MDEAREALAKMRQLAIRHADVSRRNLCSEALNSPRAVLRSATGSSAAKAGSQPLSLVRQERNFWMRRQGTRNRCQRQRTPAGTKKAPRPGAKIPAQTAYLSLMGNYPVRNGWMVETVEIELAAYHAVIESNLLLSQEREFSGQRRPAGIGLCDFLINIGSYFLSPSLQPELGARR
jgi:hypothetical protein